MDDSRRSSSASISSLRFDAWIVIKVSFSSYLTISTRSRDADAHADMLILFSMCVLMLLATMAVHALSQHTMRHLHLSSRTVTFSVVLRTWTQGSSHHCAPIHDPGMMYLFFVIELAASVASVMYPPMSISRHWLILFQWQLVLLIDLIEDYLCL